jgi:hypothetical protein
MEFAEPKWLVEPLWPSDSCGFIAGPSGVRKSWLCLELGLSVSTGRPFLSKFKIGRPGKVLYVAGEDKLRGLHARLSMLARHHGTDVAKFKTYALVSRQNTLTDPQHKASFEAFCAAHKPSLVILDPFVRMHDGDESSARDMAPILSFARQAQEKHGFALIITHHVRKPGSSGAASGLTSSSLRGSGDLYAWADTVVFVERPSHSRQRVEFWIDKQRDAVEHPHVLVADFVEDSDGVKGGFVFRGNKEDVPTKMDDDLLKILVPFGAQGVGKNELLEKLVGNNDRKKQAIKRQITARTIEQVLGRALGKLGPEATKAYLRLRPLPSAVASPQHPRP